MIKVLFICHGNICRSPMAEFMFKNMVDDNYIIDSKATSYEEIGNDIHCGTKHILDKYNIPYTKRKAQRFEESDYDYYDYILCMDDYNILNLNRIKKDNLSKYKKIRYLIDNKDVSDPWYTGDFEKTYKDILEALQEFLKELEK